MTYVQPLPAPAPLQGDALLDTMHDWLAGVLGAALDESMIRPYAQGTPPVIPDAGAAWMAFTISSPEADTFPYLSQADDETISLQRQERLHLLCSFYDTGVGGRAGELASLLRDGVIIPQNVETLALENIGLVDTEEQVALPSMLKTRWQWRVDQLIVLTRQVDRQYAQASIASANGTLNTDGGLPPVAIEAEQ